MIAGIGKLPVTLADRSIILTLRRKLKGETVERLRLDRLDHYADIRPRALRWAVDHGAAIRNSDPELPAGLNDRAADNWRSLFIVAEVAGGDWPAKARTAVNHLVDMETEDDSINVQLLRDIKAAFDRRDRIKLPTKDLLDELAADDEAPWSTWNKGKPMTARQLANRLHGFGISSYTIKTGYGDQTAKGYVLDRFKDAFKRYLPAPSVTPSPSRNGADSGDFPSVTGTVALRNEKSDKASNGASRDGVTDKNTPPKTEYI